MGSLALLQSLKESVLGQANVKVIYGEPISAHEKTIIPAIVNSTPALAWESLIASAFFVLAVAGFKKNLWLIVTALAAHGIFDFFPRFKLSEMGISCLFTRAPAPFVSATNGEQSTADASWRLRSSRVGRIEYVLAVPHAQRADTRDVWKF